ncbi:periplasmic protein thiol:disulfide oxidoreductase, DsbE subfamily [Rubellimicrobium thermophilum DSM 16684]|uniref:Periplasmic protein thiol:disulfide oxidoreductase, DsbE subfamily n=1 Tax=Rubellimicrobium thermophilum DSM 16684 TaxID=1123069 RepID=S9SAP5_9RHOB|nr:DsbE family thiol:disulfide interchange protein [Rubellimicrobium thermophilum]EPX87210.1 periplasmic protein thiol:disulfide oxidoreductase, DsbE subfamily [Rubellimicrobium thermophilum DSM 16684]
MARPRLLILIPPVVFAAMAGLFVAGMMNDRGQELPSALVGQAAPALAVVPLPGHPPIDPAILTDGEVKLVNFWASWCAPCRLEHPILVELAAEGVPIYGIAVRDREADSLAFLGELGNPYRGVGRDSTNRVSLDWGTYGVPETFVLTGDGIVVDRLPFPLTPQLVETRLRPALERAAPEG